MGTILHARVDFVQSNLALVAFDPLVYTSWAMAAKPAKPNAHAEWMRVLVVENDPELRDAVTSAVLARGHTVTPVDSTDEAVHWVESGIVDLVFADPTSATASNAHLIRAIHAQRHPVSIVVTHGPNDNEMSSLRGAPLDTLQYPFSDESVDTVLNRAREHHMLPNGRVKVLPFLTERCQFVIPSRLEYLDAVLNYISERLVAMGIIEQDSHEVVLALDEAIVNAIKHGNSYDAVKRVTIVVELSQAEARFTIADEGPGFSLHTVPDPCAPENLLRTSGRGLLLIRTIMDDVSYNEAGNAVTMVKRSPLSRA